MRLLALTMAAKIRNPSLEQPQKSTLGTAIAETSVTRSGIVHTILIAEHVGRARLLEQGLREAGCEIVARLADTQRLLAQMGTSKAALIVLETRMPDAVTLEQIGRVYQAHPCPIVVFTQCGDTAITSAAVKAGVSAYIVDGLRSERIRPILDVAVTRFVEMQGLQKELQKAAMILHERKHIERAKGILMKRTKMEENAAYQLLRKMAMDRNKRIADMAESIVTAEELIALKYG